MNNLDTLYLSQVISLYPTRDFNVKFTKKFHPYETDS